MTEQEYNDKRDAFDRLRRKETDMLERLSACDFEDEQLFKDLVPVQQRRAKIGRELNIDWYNE